MSEKPFGLSVKALITDDEGRWLLLRRSMKSRFFRGEWDLPGGKLDPGERFDEAVVREVAEETGLRASVAGAAGVGEFELPAVHVVVLYVRAKASPGQVVLSGEHEAFEWVAPDKLLEMNLCQDLRAFVEKHPRPGAV
jgi:8-oxo-dGTP diphosphatase